METFGMILLTLLTVLGSAILGWLARRYALGGRCEPFGSDELADSLSDGSGSAAGVVGTAAAGAAAVGYAADRSGAGSQGAGATGSGGATAAKFSSGAGSDTVSSGKGTSAGQSGAAGSRTSNGSASAQATSSSSAGSSGAGASTKSEWFDGDASASGSSGGGSGGSTSTGSSGSGAAAAVGTAGAAGAAAKLISGSGDDAKAGSAGTSSTARDGSGSGGGGSAGASGGGIGSSSPTSGSSGAASSGSAGSTTASGFVGGSANAPGGASASTSSTGGSTQQVARGSATHSAPSGSDTATAPSAVGGTAAGGSNAADDDDGDDGVSLVDVPATLSAEEAEAERLLASDEEIAAPSSRLDAPRPSHSPDDLTKIKGIGPKINGQLNDRGIYYYDQIADFSGSDLAWADRELGFKGRAVRDRWIPQARGLMDASALEGGDGTAAKGSGAASPELTASQAEVRQLRTRLGLNPDSGSGANDPSKSDAQRLEASQQEARELRQQLWSKEEAEKAEKAKEASASGSSTGSGAAGAAAGGATAAAGLGSFGGLSSEEAEAERMIASGSAPKSASNRLDAPTPGFDPDDLTKIRGIGKPTQSRLNRKGIYYYDQIAGFTGGDLAWADKEMNLEGRVVSDRWIPQAKLLAGEIDESGSGARAATGATATDSAASSALDDDDGSEGEALVDVPKALTAEETEAERLLASGEEIAPPASRLDAPRSGQSPDDLTKIKGIGPKINNKLNDQGIYYYDQIAGFKGSDLAWADRELDFKGRAVRDRWVPQARGLMELSGSDEPAAPAPKTLLDKPIEGRAPDDLTAIKGIGNVLQKQLNEKGIYYYSQIAEFSDSDQEWANQTLGFPGRVERDDWIPQARELAEGRASRRGVLSDAGKQLGAMSDDVEPGEMSGDETEAMRLIESGTFVADDSNRPASLLTSPSNGAADDLQRIKGVGPKLNDLLNSLGIYYFRQIGEFSATDIAWVDSKLQFKGRIVRDRWVDQAKRLS